MPTYRELLAQTKAEIDEIGTPEAHERLSEPDAPLFLDIREVDEWQEGHIAGAVHIPRGNLESRVEGLVPDKDREILIYCAAGSRSAFAAKALGELGYTDVASVAGGFSDWKRNGYDFTTPKTLTPAQRSRYSRHLLIPEVGDEGQQKLLNARVLLIGAGGLGSPASLYLAAAGVGTLGIVDADVVDDSNLQRQIVHSTERLGEPKVLSAKRTIEALNPDVTVIPYEERLTSDNVERIVGAGWDVIVDGADNFPTRYLVNDASVWHDIPVVHGSRGSSHCLRASRWPVLPLPLPLPAATRARTELRGRRRSRRPPRHRRLLAGKRGAEADPWRRRVADRTPAALRCPPDDLRRGEREARPNLPCLR